MVVFAPCCHARCVRSDSRTRIALDARRCDAMASGSIGSAGRHRKSRSVFRASAFRHDSTTAATLAFALVGGWQKRRRSPESERCFVVVAVAVAVGRVLGALFPPLARISEAGVTIIIFSLILSSQPLPTTTTTTPSSLLFCLFCVARSARRPAYAASWFSISLKRSLPLAQQHSRSLAPARGYRQGAHAWRLHFLSHMAPRVCVKVCVSLSACVCVCV